MSSDITVSDLAFLSGKNQIGLEWRYNDPNADGLPYLRLRYFQVAWGFVPGFIHGTINVFDGTSAIDGPIMAGVTKYYRVRAFNQSDEPGEWSEEVSAREASVDPLSWSGTQEVDFFPTISSEVGSVQSHDPAFADSPIAYKRVGSLVMYAFGFGLFSATGASGYVRRGPIPYQLKSGTKFAGRGIKFSAVGGSNSSINAVPVDGGDGNTYIDVYKYDGSFVSLPDSSGILVSGFFELELD